ncbi:MAG: type II toxin-antitoxin system VapB family antitoxin [Rhizobiaceae bacterium]|nr:type II toxin-antitoxin system VapB family antitoxin [Rhizobiaceae bacterium]
MNLQIRDPRAHELASQLAERKKISMTEAVISALEAELQRSEATVPLADRLALIAKDLAAQAKPGGHDMTKDDIDAMWGHP